MRMNFLELWTPIFMCFIFSLGFVHRAVSGIWNCRKIMLAAFFSCHSKFANFSFPQNEAVDVDIDEILDMDTDEIRRSFLYVSWADLDMRLTKFQRKTLELSLCFSTHRHSFRPRTARKRTRKFSNLSAISWIVQRRFELISKSMSKIWSER